MATLSDTTALQLLTRLQGAINAHDLDRFTGCFAEGYRAEIPSHPARSFVGSEQVRRNWSQILGGVADIQATLRSAVGDGRFAWGEWLWTGTRLDGASFAMAGVTILEVVDEHIVSSRFYMEPVETASGDVTADISRALGQAATR